MKVENRLTRITLSEKESKALVKALEVFQELEEENGFDTTKCEITSECTAFNEEYSVNQILDAIYSIGRRNLF